VGMGGGFGWGGWGWGGWGWGWGVVGGGVEGVLVFERGGAGGGLGFGDVVDLAVLVFRDVRFG
jgi:hypothetical protein